MVTMSTEVIKLKITVEPDEKEVINSITKFLGFRYPGDFIRSIIKKALRDWICMNWDKVEIALRVNGASNYYVRSIYEKYGCGVNQT